MLVGLSAPFVKDVPTPTGSEWQTSDPEEIRLFQADPMCGQPFSNAMSYSILKGFHSLWLPENESRIPADLPILLIAGTEDPVGGQTATIQDLITRYMGQGRKLSLEYRFYAGAGRLSGRVGRVHRDDRHPAAGGMPVSRVPIGMLLGWGVGAATGALYDADRMDTGDEAIAAFGRLIPPGGNAILAETDEVTTEPLEQFAAGFGGKVSRRPLDEVLAELEAQDEAAREADKAARKAIREHKKQERKEDFQKRLDALKGKFHKD